MDSYIYTAAGVTTRVTAPAAGILRITHTKRDHFLPDESPVVVLRDRIDGALMEEGGAAVFTAGGLRVRVDPISGAIAIETEDGKPLLREPDRRPHTLVEKPVVRYRYDPDAPVEEYQSIDGVRARVKASESYVDRTAYECKQQFEFDEEEALFGLGSHEEGWANLRGHARILYQHNMKAVVPCLVSTTGWGILFDMGCMMAFHDDEEGSYLWADCADELDWYFFYGDGSYASLMGLYRTLTGPTPLLPRYALGYTQSKERYVDAEEMVDVAAEYRRRNIPIDLIVLDWQSWPQGQWGWKTFDRTRFPDPDAFTAALHDKNVKLMISIWPSMQGDENEDRREMLENGYMLGNRVFYDAFNPAARALYWRQANEHLFSHGVDAWWCDDSEPFESDWRGEIKPEPFVRAMINTDEAKRYLDPAKLNLYSLWHSRGIYEGQRSVTEEKRVLNLTRSAYAGQHRYATVTWSGDVSARWEVLRRHIPEGLNFCAAGENGWSVDIGAFFPSGGAGPWFLDGDYPDGAQDPGYRELFTRWMQYGALLPMMRAHGTGTPREIWRFGEAGEPFYDAIAAAIRLRYHLLPYLYTLLADNSETGVPMLRHPALVFPEDPFLQDLDDQLMLGDFLLAVPVTRPMYYLPQGKPVEAPDDTVMVRLPDGHLWYELDSGLRFAGGQDVTISAPLNKLPIFLRSGAILPWAGEVQCTEELTDAPLTLRVYPGEDGDFALYEDAGDGYGYERGEKSRTPIHWDDTARTLTIAAREGAFPGMPESRTFTAEIAGLGTRTVTYTGDAVTLRF